MSTESLAFVYQKISFPKSLKGFINSKLNKTKPSVGFSRDIDPDQFNISVIKVMIDPGVND
jgi:hypothetical protein